MRRMLSNKNVIDVVNEGIQNNEIEIPQELPTIGSGDAGKVLTVNSDETGVEWADAGGGSLYMHNIYIRIYGSDIGVVTIYWIDSDSTAITKNTLVTRLGLTSSTNSKLFNANGQFYKNGDGEYPVFQVSLKNNGEVNWIYCIDPLTHYNSKTFTTGWSVNELTDNVWPIA